MTDADENVAYRIDGEGARSGELMVDEAYSEENPVWVVNVSEAAPDGVIQMAPPQPCDPGDPECGGDPGPVPGGPAHTCPGPPPVEPLNTVSLVKMGEMQVTKQYDSWFNGGSEIYISHPLVGLNFADPSSSTVGVSTFERYFSRDEIASETWKSIDQQYISNWRPEIRNQKLAVHEHDPHGPFTFSGQVGLSIPIPGSGTPPVTVNPQIGFSVTFKSNDPIIYQHDHDRASYFLFNRRGDVDNAGTRTADCWRVYKGGEYLKFTLPYILGNYPGQPV